MSISFGPTPQRQTIENLFGGSENLQKIPTLTLISQPSKEPEELRKLLAERGIVRVTYPVSVSKTDPEYMQNAEDIYLQTDKGLLLFHYEPKKDDELIESRYVPWKVAVNEEADNKLFKAEYGRDFSAVHKAELYSIKSLRQEDFGEISKIATEKLSHIKLSYWQRLKNTVSKSLDWGTDSD